MPFYQKVFLAGASGACGGFVGTPGDMVNVRMQNDMKLPADKRRKCVYYYYYYYLALSKFAVFEIALIKFLATITH